jgi:hypothetical protein
VRRGPLGRRVAAVLGATSVALSRIGNPPPALNSPSVHNRYLSPVSGTISTTSGLKPGAMPNARVKTLRWGCKRAWSSVSSPARTSSPTMLWSLVTWSNRPGGSVPTTRGTRGPGLATSPRSLMPSATAKSASSARTASWLGDLTNRRRIAEGEGRRPCYRAAANVDPDQADLLDDIEVLRDDLSAAARPAYAGCPSGPGRPRRGAVGLTPRCCTLRIWRSSAKRRRASRPASP